MVFGIYCVRDVKSGFQTPTAQVNDAVAVRGFASAVINSDSVLFTHASDFALYKVAEFDADTGRITPLDLPVELMQASAALAMKEVGGWRVHISTDYVFGKEPYNTPCAPDQKGTPTGVYGMTKLRGEENIKASGCKYVIIRTAWLYSEFGKNFCKTMLNLTSSRSQIKVVFDQCGTPTYALDLASAIVKILLAPKQGVYHYSNEGVCSWYDFTKMIARLAGHNDCDILPCYSSEYPSAVRRPSYSVLDKRAIKETFGVDVPYWVDSLQRCIENMK